MAPVTMASLPVDTIKIQARQAYVIRAQTQHCPWSEVSRIDADECRLLCRRYDLAVGNGSLALLSKVMGPHSRGGDFVDKHQIWRTTPPNTPQQRVALTETES